MASTIAPFIMDLIEKQHPSVTLQRHFTNANKVSQSVLEESLTENRGFVQDYVGALSSEPVSKLSASTSAVAGSTTAASAPARPSDENCPSIAVSFDGQYNRPVYHGFDGKATSVSEPVVEQETDMNLLVAYSVVSKKDGSYGQEKVSQAITFTPRMSLFSQRVRSNKRIHSPAAHQWVRS